jgi:outer membrane protein
VEAGYYLTKNWAVSLTAGWPPRAHIHPAGSISGFGKLGIATYGPATLTVHYHFTGLGRFQPYIGAGPTFLIGIRNQDRLIQNLDLQNSIGIAGQIGFDYMLNNRWGVFLDVKKAYLRTKETGTIGGAPIIGKVKLDPLVISTGVTYRF